ncbi:MAG: LuxR C-terminal-related transcriptional regulator [Bifidobacteriaceae bacterium]|nr:LuxR C-terminal-related transcriptional regulator [Bifidobacteriaceae bacterium]
MGNPNRGLFALFSIGGGLMLLWYKRLMIAIPPDSRLVFLLFCGLGFLLAAFLLDSRRAVPSGRSIILAGLVCTMPSTVLAAASGPAGWVGLAVAGAGAGLAYYAIVFTGLTALPARWRATAFASVFMLAGLINTTTDLAELPWLRVAGEIPNLVLGEVSLAFALTLMVWRGRVFTRPTSPSASPLASRPASPLDSRLTDQPASPSASPLTSQPASPPAADATSQDSAQGSWPRPPDTGVTAVIGIGGLAVASFLGLYALLSLYESVSYPVLVTGLGSSGLIRYVELPLFLAAAWLADRIGRPVGILAAMAAGLIGATGLAAGPGGTVANLAALCVVLATIMFPVACCALIADVMGFASRPALLGSLCFAPVVMGQAIDSLVKPLTESLSGEARFIWSLSLAAVWVVVTVVLLEMIRRSFVASSVAAALNATAHPTQPGVIGHAVGSAGHGNASCDDALLTAAARTPANPPAASNPLSSSDPSGITNPLSSSSPPGSSNPPGITNPLSSSKPPGVTNPPGQAEPGASSYAIRPTDGLDLLALARQAAAKAGLTRRESEVFALSTQGLSVRQIAATLFVTEATVKFHITNMLRKTGTTSRSEMIRSLLDQVDADRG